MDNTEAERVIIEAAFQHLFRLRTKTAPCGGEKYTDAEIEEALRHYVPEENLNRALYGVRRLSDRAA